MEIDRTMRDGCNVVAFTGPINLFTAARVRRVLLKDLAERPYGIVCDLSGVESLDPACATVFSTVANHPSSDWPATAILLCRAQPAVVEVLDRLTVPHVLPLHDTLEAALDQVAARPPYLRDELRLAPTATAAAAARLYVRDVLQYWRLALPDQDVIDLAELLAGELVTNAVVHARSSLRLRLELRGDVLHIGVHDASPRRLRLVPRDADSEAVWCTLPLWRRQGPTAGAGP